MMALRRSSNAAVRFFRFERARTGSGQRVAVQIDPTSIAATSSSPPGTGSRHHPDPDLIAQHDRQGKSVAESGGPHDGRDPRPQVS